MKHSYAKDVLLSFALQIFENGRSFLLIPVIAKTIGASGYGIWVQVKIGIAFLCPFLLLGLGGGLSRFLPGSSKKEIQNGIFSSFIVALTTGTGLALLIILSEGIIEKYIESIPNSGLFIKGLALLCIAEPLNNLSSEYFRTFREVKRLFAFSILDTIFEFIPVFWTAYNGFGIAVVIFAFACGRFFSAVIKNLYIFLKIGFGNLRKDIIEKFVKYGFPLIGVNIFFYISNYLDRYLIGYFHSAKEVGIYSLAYTVGYIVVLISAPWDRVLVPTITSYWNEGNIKEANGYFNDTFRYMLIVTLPVVVFISGVGIEIIKILSTPEFASAAYIIPVMMIVFLMHQFGVYFLRVVMLGFNSTTAVKIYGIVSAISIILNILLIPRFSLYGASVSMLLSYTTLYIVFYSLALKKIFVEPYFLLTMKILLATLPGLIILLFIQSNQIFLWISLLFSILLYVGSLLAMGIISKKEWMFAKSLFQPGGF